MADERFTALPTAEEYALFREAYAETYPVRPLLNAIDAKEAELAQTQVLLDGAMKRLGENDEEITQLRSVALAARVLVQSANNRLACDEVSVDEPALTALESALEAAGFGMSEEEFERGVANEMGASHE